jgi:aspartate 1-decarboxylase
VLNINNGARFITYAIAADDNAGAVILNGAAARLGQIGDRLIILSYCSVNEDDSRRHTPRVVFVDERNRVREIHDAAPD